MTYFMFSYTKALKSSVYFALRAHFPLDQPYRKCSVVTCGWYLSLDSIVLIYNSVFQKSSSHILFNFHKYQSPVLSSPLPNP